MNEEYRLYLYPYELRRITNVVESYIDELDKDMGFMYDEYPDKEYLNLMLEKLHKRIICTLNTDKKDKIDNACAIADAVFVNQIYLKRYSFDLI